MSLNHLLHRASRTRLTRGSVPILLILGLVLVPLLVITVASSLSSLNILPSEKQAIEDRYAQEREAGRQNPAPKDPNAPAPPDPIPDFRYPTGIIEGGDVPFPSQFVRIMNVWQEYVGNDLLVVYAGSTVEDPPEGLVIVGTLSDDLSKVGFERFLTPIKGGAVRITAARNLQLWLESTSGASFIFDVPSSTFTINQPPIADADGPYEDNEGSPVTINASGSSDPDPGDTLAYSFDCTDDGTFEVIDQTESTFECTYGDNGSFTARVRVKDSGGLTDEATAEVTVNNLPPSAALDTSSAIAFASGNAFLGRKKVNLHT